MSQDGKVAIRKLKTGISGLDEVLGGGLPELSFNLIGGGPGCGKTTMVQQIMFSNASRERPALYLSVQGEPQLKVLRYQQQFTFFDLAKVNDGVRFTHLGWELAEQGLDKVLKTIVREVETAKPALVIVDSFRSLVRTAGAANGGGRAQVEDFVHRLALHMTSWEATTFLVGGFAHHEDEENPVFTVADGLFWLYQSIERNSMVRKLQVVKVRGQEQIQGLQTFRITTDGLQVFPRLAKPETSRPRQETRPRLSTGVAALDEMLGGGIPAGYSVLIAGPSGSGKTVLSTQFVTAGVRQGEAGIIAIFEKRPDEYQRTSALATELQEMVASGKLELIYLRPLDLSIDETLFELRRAVERSGAKRLAIDSLSGFELALAPTYREDFRESLYRMVGALTGMGVTVMMTVELADSFVDLRFSPHGIAFLTDAIILQRYVEIEGAIQRLLGVIKVRASRHSKELRQYEIADEGLVVGGPLKGFRGLLSGRPQGDQRTPFSSRSKAGAGASLQEP